MKYKHLTSLTLAVVFLFNILLEIPFLNISLQAETVTDSATGIVFDTSTGTITDYIGHTANLIVPSSINGVAITGIGPYTFSNNSELISVTLPDNLTSISAFAFQSCAGLTSITIPIGVTSIGSWAFNDCFALTAINVNSSNTVYSSANGVLFNKDKTIILQYPIGNTATSYAIPSSVINIELYAFANADNLTIITIPNSVKTIGDGAFSSCDLLSVIIIPNSVTSLGDDAFTSCEKMTSVTLSNNIKSIGIRAFYYCRALTSITIPSGVTSIGQGAFERCTSLASVTIPASVTYIGSGAFQSCWVLGSVTIPDGVISIENYTFSGCRGLKNISIPSSVQSIGDQVFSSCTSLTAINVDSSNTYISSINGVLFNKENTTLIQYPVGNTAVSYSIPSGVVSIGSGAFMECLALTSLVIPSSVTNIGFQAFSNCIKMSNVTLSNGLFSIGDYAFQQCPLLTSINIPDSVTSIGNDVFYECVALVAINVGSSNTVFSSDNGVLYDKNKTALIIYPMGKTATSYTVPNGVITIRAYAFARCKELTSIALPNSVTSISESAFMNCILLNSMNIPNGVTTIEPHTFLGCFALKSITIPDSVTKIATSAFYSCKGLTTVTLPNSVTVIDSFAFSECISLKSINIPCNLATLDSYTFQHCISLTNVTIPSSVKTIWNGAFYNCTELTSIAIPSSVTEMGYGDVFTGCTKLTIRGVTGSAAEYQATKNSIPFVAITEAVVTFNSQAGSAVASKSAISNTLITAPASPTKSDFAFIGWYTAATGGTIVTFPYTVANSVTLFAHWKAIIQPPTNLTSPEKTDTAVTLNWSTQATATGYNIYNNGVKVNLAPITKTYYTVLGLTPTAAYSFTVRSVNSYGESENSTALPVTTSATPTTGVIYTMDSPVGKAGQEITVAVRVNAGSNIGRGDFMLNYDSSILTFVSAQIGSVLITDATNIITTPFDGVVLLNYTGKNGALITNAGTLMTVTFTIKTGTLEQTSPLVLETSNVSDLVNPITGTVIKAYASVRNRLKGDTNSDNDVNIVDVMLALRHSAGLITLSSEDSSCSDVNNDGEVNIVDVMLILRFSAGLISSF